MRLRIPSYTAAPRGFLDYGQGPDGNLTRRHKEDGPYGVFIEYEYEAVNPCPDWGEVEREYNPLWIQAEGDLKHLLWGNSDERERARRALETLNAELCVKGSSESEGLIEIRNWSNAGIQLGKAVRDFHIYGSIARFEDVRDFIWERIITMRYPHNWRVKREDFQQRVEDSYQDYRRRERDVDPEDGIFQEWSLENPPGPPPSRSPPSYHTNTPVPGEQASQSGQSRQQVLLNNQHPAPRLQRQPARPNTRDNSSPRPYPRSTEAQVTRRRSARIRDHYPEESPRMRGWLNIR